MKKKLLFPCMLLVLVTVLTGVFTSFASAEETVTMTEVNRGAATPAAGDIVTISTEEELELFSAYVAKEATVTAGIIFRLEADIALTNSTDTSNASTMEPIGGVVSGKNFSAVAFKGIFDGNGKTISNYVMTNLAVLTDGTTQKLKSSANRSFIPVLESGEIRDLTLSVKSVSGVSPTEYGVLVSEATDAKITGCTVVSEDAASTFSFTGSSSLGGIVGAATNSVLDSCVVTLKLEGAGTVGGAVGVAKNTAIRNCIVGGAYSNTSTSSFVGGVIGQLTEGSTVKNCYTNAALSGSGSLGGIAGTVASDATIENCASAATLTHGVGVSYGLIAAKNEGTITNAFGLRASDDEKVEYQAVGGGAGTATDVYAYTVTADGENYTFTVGKVERIVDSEAQTTRYVFTAEDPAISLADALNEWVSENTTAETVYVNWVEIGNTVTNCFHATTTLIPYDGEDATCVEVGRGYRACSVCGEVMEEDLEIPATGIHRKPADVWACMSYDCLDCGAHIDAETDHGFSVADAPCVARKCTICQQMIAPTVEHVKPSDYDEEKNCKSYACTVCQNTVAGDGQHTYDGEAKPCVDSTCTVCGETLPATANHRAGVAATCFRAQVCIVCSSEINPKLEHIPGAEGDCGNSQDCVLCGSVLVPPTGDHTRNKDHATCSGGVFCLVCESELEAKLTHIPADESETDCGHGQVCTLCHVVLKDATGTHTVDWSTATVIREATADRTGIVRGNCSVCGKEVERYTKMIAYDADGKVSISGGNMALYVGSTATITLGKVADYGTLVLPEGYVPLQVATIGLADVDGTALSLSGNATVKMILNVSVAKMTAQNLKLYKIDGTTVTEIAIDTLADGYVTFTASGTGTYLIAGVKTVAFEMIGTYIPEAVPNETAALVGTPAYEKKDDEI